YNEEGLPIVEITEPYFSDDEENKDEKSKQPALLPFSQKTPEEQAEDRAILDRIAELEREDEERERRREAGEIVTSEEETDSDDNGLPIEYDDEDSADEFRPKGLDSDEEYEEEVWEHSDDEDEEDAYEGTSRKPGEKAVRFADQVAKAIKSKSNSKSTLVAPPSVSAPTTTSPSATKAKSPSDLINQMKAKQQAVRSAATSEQIVNMANLESTFANLTTVPPSVKAPVFEEKNKPEPAPLKSALKPPPKKTSLFKQMRAEAEEKTKNTPVLVESIDVAQDIPPKKLSKFARDRAAAGKSTSANTTLAKPAVMGASENVSEKNVVELPVSPLAQAKNKMNIPEASEVVERNVSPAIPSISESRLLSKAMVSEVKEATPGKSSISNLTTQGFEEPLPSRRKPSLFRRQQQNQAINHLEPEPAVPEASFVDPDDDNDIKEYRSVKAIPTVVSARSISSSASKEPVTSPSEPKSENDVGPIIPADPAKRIIPVAASSKLRDTSLMKGAVVEHEEFEPVDEDELEDDMLMRQVVTEYQERRQAMIAKHGAFNREDIERMWEQQVVIPPGMIIPEPQQIERAKNKSQDIDEDNEETNEGGKSEQKPIAIDDRNLPPKKLSLFRAARLSGTLAKQ
ncbi:hypothetical protein BX616_004037, partial [Lobosporangium transversale]